MIGITINQRYKIEEEIGRGGMGTVYRASDNVLQRDVALKLLSATRLGTEGRSRMLREAQTVARLNHPNIVTVYDAGEYEENPYIIMELVDGQILGEVNPTEPDEILNIAKQICAALTHAHKQNIIHRDLKPENIAILTDGTVKLMDFGLARSVASRMTVEGTILGTVHYMAPEQAQGHEVDHRTDLYALGILLYEFTTGSLPFEAENPVAIITQHISAPPVPPRAKRDSIPYYLDRLILSLLEKDPADRPQSADDVIAALEAQVTPEKEQEAELSVLDRISRGRMIGRKSEMQQAQSLWQRASEGRGQLMLLSGEPGIGKTRFTKEVITQAEVAGGLVLVGASYAEGGMPYSAFRQVLRKGLRSTTGRNLDVPREILTDLLSLVPELRSSYPDLKKEINSELPDPQQLWEHFVIFINMLSAQKPVLIVIEDIHWSDSGSLSLARHLARHTKENAVMLLYNYREVEIHENRAFHDMLLDFNRERVGTRIKLIRLERDQTHEMLQTLFNEQITEEFLDGIYRETEGHPFFIEEVIKALVESGRLYYENGSWHRPSIEELGIPQSVQVAIQSRLDALPENAHELLRQAAIFGREFDFKYLLEASSADELELIDMLELAESAQIIEEMDSDSGDPRFQFVHALIPTTLVEDTRTLKRRVLHRRTAEVLEAHEPNNLRALAYHLTEAGEVEKAVEYHLQLADAARKLLANQEAINSYEQALDFLRETEMVERTRDTLFKLALSYQNNFEFDNAQRVYDEAFSLQRKLEQEIVDLPVAPHPLRLLLQPPETLDPAKAQDVASGFYIHMLGRSLTLLQPGGNVVPHMAERWEVQNDGLRYVFTLRRGLKWSDGSPLTAHDFEYGVKRVLDPEINSKSAPLFYIIKKAEAYHKGQLSDSSTVGVRALDDHTLQYDLERVTGYFTKLMAQSTMCPQPRAVIEKYADNWTEPENHVSSGPFILESIQHDENRAGKIVMRRNPHFFLPFSGNLEKLEAIHPGIEELSLAPYYKDEVDVALISIAQTPEKILRARRELAQDIRMAGTHYTYYIAFNCREAPFNNRLVRQAFSHAIDKNYLLGEKKIINQPGHGGLIPPAIAGHNPNTGYKFDPVQARRLLNEAGYPNGEGFPALHLSIGQGERNRLDISLLKDMWQETLNIEITFEQVSFKKLMDIASQINLEPGESHPLMFMGWYMDYPDPHNMLVEATWVSGSGWQNDKFNSLIQTANNTLDPKKRIQLYQEADKLVLEECVVIPMDYGINEWLLKPWVKNYYPDPDTILSEIAAAIIEHHE